MFESVALVPLAKAGSSQLLEVIIMMSSGGLGSCVRILYSVYLLDNVLLIFVFPFLVFPVS